MSNPDPKNSDPVTQTGEPAGAAPADIELDKQEWREALEDILACYGTQGVQEILASLGNWCAGQQLPVRVGNVNTPYLNSIPFSQQAEYPGDLELEQRLENILRWNAMVMVLKGQDAGTRVGGHIAIYASAATLMEVGFNHFFRN